MRLLAKGLTNEEVLAKVQAEHPDARTTLQSISWYRSDMRRRGMKVPSQVEARSRVERT
jgi:hypothetical protein